MQDFQVKDLTPGSYFSEPLYLDSKYILLAPEIPVTEALKKRLILWSYNKVKTEGRQVENMVTEPTPAKSESLNGAAVLQKDIHEKQEWETARKIYSDFLQFAERTFKEYLENDILNIQPISEAVKTVASNIRAYRRFLLNFDELHIQSPDPLINKAVRTTVLSLNLADILKYPPHKMIELGIACLLHDIGMFRLPKTLYTANRKLTPQERKSLMAHTIVGYQVLREHSFPMNIALSALEHQERIDGTGYPRQLTESKISDYGKIIAVADTYNALTSSRPYRDKRDGHSSIMDMLKNGKTKFDESILRALVLSLSIYPIGTAVELSNSAQGIVVDVNTEDPRNPIVKLLINGENEHFHDEPVIRTQGEEGIHVSRVLSGEEEEHLRELLNN
ncbi:MAG: HD-GYP domain-containing protein [Spirochaetales bacterium]|nr:HD-GYP domain-containing protein [Spirochaetales bacterium]MCF7937056.1 HD-GYP domain-containing protein [Spirochaetales bacterium]